MMIFARSSEALDLDDAKDLLAKFESGGFGRWRTFRRAKGLVTDRVEEVEPEVLAGLRLPIRVRGMEVGTMAEALGALIRGGLEDQLRRRDLLGRFPYSLAMSIDEGFKLFWIRWLEGGKWSTTLNVKMRGADTTRDVYDPFARLGIDHEIVQGDGEARLVLRLEEDEFDLGILRRPENGFFKIEESLVDLLFERILSGAGECSDGSSTAMVTFVLGDALEEEDAECRDDAVELCKAVAASNLFHCVEYEINYEGELSWIEWERRRESGQFHEQYMGRLEGKLDVGFLSDGSGYFLAVRGDDTDLPNEIGKFSLTV